MAFFFESLLMELLVVVGLLTAGAYVYLNQAWTYWKKRGVPQLEPTFPWGNFADVFAVKKNIGHLYEDIYRKAKGTKLVGAYMFARPVLVLRDPELIKAAMVKDFNHFMDRGFYDDSEREPLLNHLFLLSGQKWRNLRVKLTPTFTSGKMKMMFPTLHEAGIQLAECLKAPAQNGVAIEVKDYVARYSTDVIASCAFGIQCNCLKDPEAEFRQWGRKLFEPTFAAMLFGFLSTLAPAVLKIISYTPIRFIDKKVTKYFMKMVEETVSYREKNNISRNDFMHLLIQLKNKGFVDVDKGDKNGVQDLGGNAYSKLSMNDLAAQAFVFFGAGFETSSSTITFCLYELALRPDIQMRVQEEIDSVLGKNNGQLTYEAVHEMEYLDKLVSETLRKYPPVPILNREVTIPYRVPNTDTQLEKGTSVIIPILALQHDPEYFPDPERFDPERFSEEEKAKRHHYAYLPFGEGPRICIGMRFGLVQTKVGLISILSRYNIHTSERTPVPLKMDPKQFLLSSVGGVWLKITERNNK